MLLKQNKYKLSIVKWALFLKAGVRFHADLVLRGAGDDAHLAARVGVGRRARQQSVLSNAPVLNKNS